VPGRPREFDSSLCFLDVSASKNLDYDDVVLSLRDDQVSSGMIRNAFNRRSVYICKLRYVARYHVHRAAYEKANPSRGGGAMLRASSKRRQPGCRKEQHGSSQIQQYRPPRGTSHFLVMRLRSRFRVAVGAVSCLSELVVILNSSPSHRQSIGVCLDRVASVPVPCSRPARMPRFPGGAKTHDRRPGK
jgi:hypothetical protein